MKTPIPAVAGAIALALALCLGACSSAPAAAPKPKPCDALTGVEASTPTTALLVQSGSGASEHASDVPTVLAGAAAESARLIVSGVGDASTPTMLTDVRLAGDGSNPLEREINLECKRGLVATSLSTIAGLGTTPELDLFTSIMTLAGNLEGSVSHGPVDVVMLTSTRNTAEPADLSDPVQLADPVGVLNRLAAAGMIPDCSGWRFYGVAAYDTALREFWRQYAERCGGALVAWTSTLSTFPATGGAIAAADTDQMAVSVQDDVVTAGLSSDVLFADNSPVLGDDAGPSLAQLLELVLATPGRITVIGHTDGGDPVAAHDLSVGRATSVATWLLAKGVPAERIVIEGRGSNDPVYPSPQTDDEHRANRRVVVMIGG